jgi:hypothetical protein
MGFIFFRALESTPDGLVTHYNNTWADWSFHAGLASSFAYGQNIPVQNPAYALSALRYPFAPDFASALLIRSGVGVPASLVWPSWAMTVLGLTGLLLWARRMTGRIAAGLIAVSLTLLGGGIGFWFFLQDASRSGLIQTLAHIPRAYDRFDPPVNIQWYNPVLSYYLPQRSFVFGLAIVMTVLLLLCPVLQSTPLLRWRTAISQLRQRSITLQAHGEPLLFLLAGSLTGLLPWFHVHSLLVLGVVTVAWALLMPRPLWLLYLVPVLILAVPRLITAVPGDPTAPASLHYPRIELGWLAGSDNPIIFWLKNTGVFWPLLLVALLSSIALGRRSRLVIAPFILLFLLANVVVFQPWDWDNTKLFVYWYLAGAVAVGALLLRLAGWLRGLGVLPAFVVWLSLVTAGALSLLQYLPPQGPTFTWLTPEEVSLAAQVRSVTSPHAIFLAGGDRPPNPVFDLAGRSLVMAYRGWLWTEGIDYSQRERDTVTMYSGSDEALALFRRYRVDYVVIGPDEIATWHANLAWFRQRFPVVVQTAGYEIFRVS